MICPRCHQEVTPDCQECKEQNDRFFQQSKAVEREIATQGEEEN